MTKKNIIALAITPDRGLEIAEVNPSTGNIVKYAHRNLDVVTIKSVIPDMDVFKELLQDALTEIGAIKGSSIYMTLPTVTMGISNYMASQNDESIKQLISNNLIEKDIIFRDNDPLVVTTGLSVTIQSKIVAYTVAVYSIIQEASRIIADLGYKIESIDVSVSAIFRALIATGKVQAQPDTTWLMLMVDNSAARLLALNGESLIEYKEEQMMYDYADTAANCDMVASSMAAYIEKIPAKYLFIISRTDNVSAEMLSTKIKYNNAIVFLEANSFGNDSFIEAPDLSEEDVKNISLDLVGTCIQDEKLFHFNLFNEELGDVYWNQQPPQFKFNGQTIVLSNEFLIKWGIIILLIILIPAIGLYMYLNGECNKIQADCDAAKSKLKQTEEQIKKYEGLISADVFSEQDEIRIGVVKNTAFYNYIDLLGRDMPKKLWLNSLTICDDYINMEGNADNIESIYTFYRNIKDSVSDSNLKLQKLALANYSINSASSDLTILDDKELPENGESSGLLDEFTENSNDIILSTNADFYEFMISDKSPKELNKILKSKAEKAQKAAKGKKKKNKEE